MLLPQPVNSACMNHSSTTGAVNSKISRRLLNVNWRCLPRLHVSNASWQNGMKSWLSSKGRDILREAPEMKYVFIEKHQAEFSIKAMCRVLRVARSGWYTWCQRRTRISTRQQFRQHCDSVVLAAFTRSKQRYGAPRLTDELRAQGYPFNVKPWRQACAVRD